MKILRILLCLLMLAPNAYSWDLSDPGEDKIMGWDNSASAADKMSWFGVSTGLVFDGPNIKVNVGTTAGTIAAGDHTHSGVYDPSGTAAAVISDTAYGVTWDNVAGIAPSKNALYDYLSTLAVASHAHTGVYEPVDATILRSANIGSTVMAHAATASQAEMEEGTVSTVKAMTPQGVAQAITAQAGTGSGDLKADGTVPLSADWNAVKAIAAESYTTPKVSGVAGDMGLYEANSTDEDTAGWRGPVTLGTNASYRLVLPVAAPTSNSMTVTFSGTASSGSGTPVSPLIHQGAFEDLDDKAPATHSRSEFVPIAWMIDGATPPAALATTDLGTRQVKTRSFQADTADQDLEMFWQAPIDIIDGAAGAGFQIKWRPIFVITSATAPAAGEGVALALQACSSGNGDTGDCTVGTASIIADADLDAHVQFDIVYGGWTEITVTDGAASEAWFMKLYRDQDNAIDDYVQPIGLIGIELKFKVTIADSY